MSTSPDQVRLTEEQQQLAQLADRAGKPWAEVLSEALSAYHLVSRPDGNGDESFYEKATRLGLISCDEGGPHDLSTDPKHMEGFGESGS